MNESSNASLPEVHRSVLLPQGASFWRRLLAFAGPAYIVSVGYMDPGNWATDLQGGAKFGYQLIWVLLMSNLMAVLLQTLSARLGIVTGKDLAQACRDYYPRPISIALWVLCEVAIVACDLAEVLGSAIALNLLFQIPIFYGVLITAADVLLLLGLQRVGIRKMEALILVLVSTIGGCFVVELFLAKPAWGQVAGGLVPSALTSESLYIAIGIIGATVMPHNLYLHSALVQTRHVGTTKEELQQACKFNLIDSVVALNCAFFVNAAILILAAASFHQTGHADVAELKEAHGLLTPLLGTSIAGVAFAVALLCAGQSSTLTGTLAGQIVMEGFLHFRISPWLRRLITRSLAIVPAALVIAIKGESGVDALLILSQVVLSLQLPFAIIPLIHFTSDKAKMGSFASGNVVKIIAWLVATIILSLNGYMVFGQLREWLGGAHSLWPWFTAVPVTVAILGLLVWLVIYPWIEKRRSYEAGVVPVGTLLPAEAYKRIGVALEVGPADNETLRHATAAARPGAILILFHIVQGVAAQVYGNAAKDLETKGDHEYLDRWAIQLRAQGYLVEVKIGFGDPVTELTRLAKECAVDVLVIGSHGHGVIGDIFRGSTVDPLRHRIEVPVLVVRAKK